MWWIGERHPGETDLDHVRFHLERAFELSVASWNGTERPEDAYDARRKQWSSSRILAWLARAGPEGKLIAVTDVDLFIPILTFVFGEAQVGGRTAVVSTARLAEPGFRDERLVLHSSSSSARAAPARRSSPVPSTPRAPAPPARSWRSPAPR